MLRNVGTLILLHTVLHAWNAPRGGGGGGGRVKKNGFCEFCLNDVEQIHLNGKFEPLVKKMPRFDWSVSPVILIILWQHIKGILINCSIFSLRLNDNRHFVFELVGYTNDNINLQWHPIKPIVAENLIMPQFHLTEDEIYTTDFTSDYSHSK